MPVDDLELSVKAVLAAGLSTGHADSYSDLVTELLWQVVEFRERITELEQAIEEAPHHQFCDAAVAATVGLSKAAPCDCWKRDALQRKVDDETN